MKKERERKMLRLENVRILRDHREILKNASLTFPSTGIYAITGKNGCGKSTLFQAITQQIDYEGKMELDGTDLKDIERNEKILMVNLEIELFLNLTVEENLKMVCSDEEEIQRYIEKFGLTEEYQKQVKKLSKGEMQKVNLLTKLLRKPPILLLDEATSNLDSGGEKKVFEELKKYSEDHLVLFITNYLPLCREYADEVYRILNKEVHNDKVIQENKIENNFSSTKILKHRKSIAKAYFEKKGIFFYFAVTVMMMFFLWSLTLKQTLSKQNIIEEELKQNIGEYIYYGKEDYSGKNDEFVQEVKRELVRYPEAGNSVVINGDISFISGGFVFVFSDEVTADMKKFSLKDDEVIINDLGRQAFFYGIEGASLSKKGGDEYITIDCLDVTYRIVYVSDQQIGGRFSICFAESQFEKYASYSFEKAKNEYIEECQTTENTTLKHPQFQNYMPLISRKNAPENLNLICGRLPEQDNEIAINMATVSQLLGYGMGVQPLFKDYPREIMEEIESECEKFLGTYVSLQLRFCSYDLPFKIVGITDYQYQVPGYYTPEYAIATMEFSDDFFQQCWSEKIASYILITKDNYKNVARFLSEHEFLPITGNQGDMENYIDNVGFRDEIYNMMVGITAAALGIFIILYFIYDTRKNEKKATILYHNGYARKELNKIKWKNSLGSVGILLLVMISRIFVTQELIKKFNPTRYYSVGSLMANQIGFIWAFSMLICLLVLLYHCIWNVFFYQKRIK